MGKLTDSIQAGWHYKIKKKYKNNLKTVYQDVTRSGKF